ncbi:unnamed protein product [Prunus armeniaca]|uniref:Uncharacterized protein n=1 Tax=Prunus armeniaca TaxID=36596 RepID=A0A6J5XLV5_PRUAR|nr:unnamed protein product [Prunus armeniaca]
MDTWQSGIGNVVQRVMIHGKTKMKPAIPGESLKSTAGLRLITQKDNLKNLKEQRELSFVFHLSARSASLFCNLSARFRLSSTQSLKVEEGN